ncbi:CDK-activating kinase assembly factor MAT1-like [Oscarella lobularis]|uniref:CDK-activating kinase assembly factor MAT1-like n=1 Tax=Oscarella lobularis TaxID=121494 RepID=UPI003313A507
MEFSCPRCQTSSFQKPNMKLLINVCGHRLCESCVDALFVHPTANCFECGRPLRRSNYRLQQFEDAIVDKEVNIRKNILKDYNMREDQFDSLDAYNDYLEEIETIVFNLTNGIDVESTKARVEEYKKKNKAMILKTRQENAREELALLAAIQEEKKEEENRRQRAILEKFEEKKFKKDANLKLLDELEKTDKSAKEILANHVPVKKQVLAQKSFRTSVVMLPIVPDEPYTYKSNHDNDVTFGPELLGLDEIESNDYLRHVADPDERQMACGFSKDIKCRRALDDAFSGLFYFSQ